MWLFVPTFVCCLRIKTEREVLSTFMSPVMKSNASATQTNGLLQAIPRQ
jgi:hypothetical protein